MSNLNLKAIAALCCALSSPVTLAQGLVQQPAPAMRARKAKQLPVQRSAIATGIQLSTTVRSASFKQEFRSLTDEIRKNKERLATIMAAADELYIRLVDMSTEEASVTFPSDEQKLLIRCEEIIRGVEGAIRVTVDGDPRARSLVQDEMRGYLRSIAKARTSVVRLNHLLRQFAPPAAVFEGKADTSALKDLATDITEKLSSMQFH